MLYLILSIIYVFQGYVFGVQFSQQNTLLSKEMYRKQLIQYLQAAGSVYILTLFCHDFSNEMHTSSARVDHSLFLPFVCTRARERIYSRANYCVHECLAIKRTNPSFMCISTHII